MYMIHDIFQQNIFYEASFDKTNKLIYHNMYMFSQPRVDIFEVIAKSILNGLYVVKAE